MWVHSATRSTVPLLSRPTLIRRHDPINDPGKPVQLRTRRRPAPPVSGAPKTPGSWPPSAGQSQNAAPLPAGSHQDGASNGMARRRRNTVPELAPRGMAKVFARSQRSHKSIGRLLPHRGFLWWCSLLPRGPLRSRRIEGIFDGLACAELHCLAGCDLDGLASLWIPPLACRPRRHIENSKSGDTDRRTRSDRGVPVRERSPGGVSDCHHVPATGCLHQWLPCMGKATTVTSG